MLQSPLTELSGVGPKRALILSEAGIHTLEDLLWRLPTGYEDLGPIVAPGEVVHEGYWRVTGSLEGVRFRRIRGRGSLVEAKLVQEAEGIDVVWFQPKYFKDRLSTLNTVVLCGKTRLHGGRMQMNHPEIATGDLAAESSRPWPRYSALGSLSGRQIRSWVEQVLKRLTPESLADSVPAALEQRLQLPSLVRALQQVHQPAVGVGFAALAARTTPEFKRLALGELVSHQLELARLGLKQRGGNKGHRYQVDDRLRQIVRDRLPFQLTPAQKRVIREMVDDLILPRPMRRLLQGDVGSGKTVVAALLMLIAAENGVQSVLLAPTELLAEQHADSLERFLGDRWGVEVLTAARSRRTEPSDQAAEVGKIFVGTHALLADRVHFSRLGLVVIDEQHRFGVTQRELLVEKGWRADLLVMSATPIPRTLALASYGDLDISLLDELPPGRQPIETVVVGRSARKKVYARLREELLEGRQVYVVFPAIRPLDREGWVCLEEMAPKIEAGLEGIEVARYHGQMSHDERQAVLSRFRRGEVRILLATTIVEVGVDVPEATVMIIEGAERFGLAQLHQLRGRVGRGEVASWCAAIHGGALTAKGQARLSAFAECRDGFEVAERDLAIRGPGELLGELQAGMIDFKVADLERDSDLLEIARATAKSMILTHGGAERFDSDGGGPWFDS